MANSVKATAMNPSVNSTQLVFYDLNSYLTYHYTGLHPILSVIVALETLTRVTVTNILLRPFLGIDYIEFTLKFSQRCPYSRMT
jgi:hypothetical protein